MVTPGNGRTRLFDFVVESNDRVAEDVFCMVLRSDVAPLLAPGEFVEVAAPGDRSDLLRVPLSFSRADASASTLRLEYAVVGDGTRRLSLMRPGDRSTVIGPCGHGWRLPAPGSRALLVSGGIGLPPIVAAAEMLSAAGLPFDAVVGAQTAARLVEDDIELLRRASASDPTSRVVVATDDGTAGHHGFVTEPMGELLSERRYGTVYTCGPVAMMAAVARLASNRDVACQASLERVMGCGFGACSCCNVAMVDGGTRSCCMDGPVFDAEEVAW